MKRILVPAILFLFLATQCRTPGSRPGGSSEPDNVPSRIDTATIQEPPATADWLYGSWRIDKRATLERMARENNMDFDSLPPETREEAVNGFNLDFHLTLGPVNWKGILQEGAKRTEGEGTHSIESQGDALLLTMNENTGSGLSTNRLRILRLEQDLLKMIFLDEEEPVFFILRRQ
ncbi:MAG: hypothetical protein KDK25_11550 [Leptospiraceae bacterium]|nr:hypothetical protein [Leptospiraceae bacterium]